RGEKGRGAPPPALGGFWGRAALIERLGATPHGAKLAPLRTVHGWRASTISHPVETAKRCGVHRDHNKTRLVETMRSSHCTAGASDPAYRLAFCRHRAPCNTGEPLGGSAGG